MEKMKIKSKLILFYGFVFTISIVLIFTISKNFLLKGFEKIENDTYSENISRFTETLNTEKESLTNITTSWSFWDDTYFYIKDRNSKYIKDNYLNDGFFENKINGVIILDTKKEIVFSKHYNFNDKKFLEPNPGLDEFVREKVAFLLSNSKTLPSNGLYFYKNELFIFTLNPILPHTKTSIKNPNGYFITLRKFDNYFKENLTKKLKLNLHLDTFQIFQKNETNTFSKNIDITKANVFIPINNDQSTFRVELTFNRDIFSFAKNTILIFSGVLVIFSFLMLLLINFFINRVITNKILHITKELALISNNQSENYCITTFANDEIGQLTSQINSTLKTVKENQNIINHSAKFASLGEMAGSIAHEINNPLSVIQGYSQKIVKSSNDNKLNHEELVKNSEKILQNVDRIVRIIKSLKLVSRSGENDEMKVIKTGEILIELENLYNYNLRNKDIQIELQHFDKNLEINVNYVQILQVFINIINNAIDAITPLENRWIRIETKVNNQNIEFHITDCGKKIPDHIAAKILEPFFTTKSIGKGTGLGLSIANKIVKNHNGSLYLNKDSENTCFVISLPLAESNIQQKAS